MPGSKRTRRYETSPGDKANGVTYTPPELAEFVARETVQVARPERTGPPLVVLDPAVGEGELLASLLRRLPKTRTVEVYGFDQDQRALEMCRQRLVGLHKRSTLHLEQQDFLAWASDFGGRQANPHFDLVIANPPYVRTQILGTAQARTLAGQFGLTGRIDLSYAFVLAIARVLGPRGVAGIIISNRFLTTRAGASVRQAIAERWHIRHVWDLGDTRLFGTAVLPAVLLAEGKNAVQSGRPRFSSIYQTREDGGSRPLVRSSTHLERLVSLACRTDDDFGFSMGPLRKRGKLRGLTLEFRL